MANQTLTKICSKCQVEKPIDDFHKNKKEKDGLQYKCKLCTKKYNEEYTVKNAKEIARKKRIYHEKNKETIARKKKLYNLAHREEIAKRRAIYRKENKSKIAAFRKDHRCEISKYIKKYRIDNKESIANYKRAYSQTDVGREVKRKADHKRRALKLGATVEDFSPIEIFERDGYRCQLCGKKTRPDYKNKYHPLYPNLDHLIPLSKGGDHSRLNTQCLCRKCNMEKQNNEHFGDQQRMFG